MGHSETQRWDMEYRTVGRKQKAEPSGEQFPSREGVRSSTCPLRRLDFFKRYL